MPSLELTAGQVLTAAHTNSYWMRQVIATGLSSARPTAYEGRAVYDTDTDALNIYAAAGVGWRPPWNMPWGYVARAVLATSTGSITTTVTDVSGLTISVPMVAGRRYKITAQLEISTTVAGDVGETTLTDGSNTRLVRTVNHLAIGSGAGQTATVLYLEDAGSTGTVTRKVRYARVLGTGTHTAGGTAADMNAYLVAEDIGPATAPA